MWINFHKKCFVIQTKKEGTHTECRRWLLHSCGHIFSLNNLSLFMFFFTNFFFSCCFIAVPTGKPVTTTAHNTSSSSIYISWKPPAPDTILGEFLGYRITYKIRDKHNDTAKEIYIRDSSVEVSTPALLIVIHSRFQNPDSRLYITVI